MDLRSLRALPLPWIRACCPPLLAVLLAAACTTGAGGDDDTPIPTPTPLPSPSPTGPVTCDPELKLEPDDVAVLAFDLWRPTPSGGTGEWRFALAENNSGAIINELTGTYLAGTVCGATDTIELSDEGCIGSAAATVLVLCPMEVLPTAAELPPNTTMQFQVTEGSGRYDCELALDGSGGAVTPGCSYTSGAAEGLDVVRVTDPRTGQFVDARVDVVDGAGVRPQPEHLVIPLGSQWQSVITGGTGFYTLTERVGGVVSIDPDGLFSTLAEGSETVDVTDDYTGLTGSIRVDVVRPLEAPLERIGDRNPNTPILSPGDLDGDGFEDLIIGVAQGNVTGYQGGAVYVYRGGAGGPEPDPAQILSHWEWVGRLGHSLAAADFDGDGEIDLAVGGPEIDGVGANSGAVFVYRGLTGDLFEQEPSLVLPGLSTNDDYGSDLASCDVNGDSIADLVVGGRTANDAGQPAQHGQAVIHLGGPGGPDIAPDQVLWGLVPDGAGGWIASNDLEAGAALAVGDLNGDGACDLVVGAYQYNSLADNTGAVLIYINDGAGFAAEPSLVISPTDPVVGDASFFGFSLAVGDLDQDGADDLVVGQYRSDQGGNDRGTVHVYRGVNLIPGPDILPAETSDWSVFADTNNDYLGYAVAVGELNGDGLPDLVIGSLNEEDVIANTGTVDIYAGRVNDLPDPQRLRRVSGFASGDYFGQKVAVGGDFDGDGLADLITFAGRDDTLGYEAGMPYIVPGDPTAPFIALSHPSEMSGRELGRGAGLVGDLDGDGFTDLAVGAPEEHAPGNNLDLGKVLLYRGGPAGFEPTPSAELQAFTGNSGSDRFGFDVSAAGDFNGDGLPDMVATARQDEAPNSFNAAYNAAPGCPGRNNTSGAAFIFAGRADGTMPSAPDFVYYGPIVNSELRSTAPAGDMNGDGFDDLILGSIVYDGVHGRDSGGAFVLTGRPSTPGVIEVICFAELVLEGLSVSDWLGTDVAGLGDIDGDGCDDTAVSAELGDQGRSNQGRVLVLFGWDPGGACARSGPEVVTLVPDDNNARAGSSLSGGLDVDGDGIGDLAVGGWNKTLAGDAVGAAWLLSGAGLAFMGAEPYVQGDVPAVIHRFADVAGTQVLTGRRPQQQFGRAVALVPDLTAPGRAGLAVASPFADPSGLGRTGLVELFRFDDNAGAFEPTPASVIVGETTDNDRSYWGWSLEAGAPEGAPFVVVGAFRSDSLHLDAGAVYVAPLP